MAAIIQQLPQEFGLGGCSVAGLCDVIRKGGILLREFVERLVGHQIVFIFGERFGCDFRHFRLLAEDERGARRILR